MELLDSDALLPYIELELDSLRHAVARPSTRQSSGIPSVSSRAQYSAASHSSQSARCDTQHDCMQSRTGSICIGCFSAQSGDALSSRLVLQICCLSTHLPSVTKFTSKRR